MAFPEPEHEDAEYGFTAVVVGINRDLRDCANVTGSGGGIAWLKRVKTILQRKWRAAKASPAA
jgi:hypothetical protein